MQFLKRGTDNAIVERQVFVPTEAPKRRRVISAAGDPSA